MHSLSEPFCCILKTCVKMEKLKLLRNANCCGSNQAVLIAALDLFLLCVWLTCSGFFQFIFTTLFILLSIIKLILRYLQIHPPLLM